MLFNITSSFQIKCTEHEFHTSRTDCFRRKPMTILGKIEHCEKKSHFKECDVVGDDTRRLPQ